MINNKKSINNILTRIDPKMKQECEAIIKKRVEDGIDEKKKSIRWITKLIPKHNYWKNIKKDIINFKEDKRGIVLGNLFTFIVVAFVFIILLGIFVYVFSVIDTSLSGNIIVGQVNVSNESANTVGMVTDALLSNANLIGIMFLFGMVIAMMINGFLVRDESPPLFFVIDFILIIFAYILAVYISNSYITVLNSLPFKDLLVANMNNPIRFMQLLPKITLITGALTMIITYIGIPKTREEEVGGF